MLRVIQWGTGVTGQHVARTIHANPNFQLVGCYTTSDSKNGRDLGDICGIGPIGVKATTDKEAIYKTPADIVIFMTLEEFGKEKPLSEICRILESGKNVLSTATTVFIYPKVAGGDVVERLEAACRKGGTTFHATGIHPGWGGDMLPLILSGNLGRIDSLLIQEILDYSTYNAPVAMYELMQFGKPPKPVPPTSIPLEAASGLGVPLLMIADSLGAKIEDVLIELECVVADKGYDIAAGRIEKGMVNGKRLSFTAIIEGKPKIKVEHVTRLGPDVAPHWPQGRGWYVTARGVPSSMRLSAEIAIDGEDAPNEACVAAAMRIVNTVPLVCAAPAGVQTLLDLPMILGRGALNKGGILG